LVKPAAAAAGSEAAPASATLRALAAEARRHYDAALAAQRSGDWARYGDEIRQLGAVLERLGSGSTQP